MTQIDWNKYRPADGSYWKWERLQKILEGRVLSGRDVLFGDDEKPEFEIETDEGVVIWRVSQADLLRQVREDPPQDGDSVRVQWVGEGKAKPGREAPKLFTYVRTRKESGPAVGDLV